MPRRSPSWRIVKAIFTKLIAKRPENVELLTRAAQNRRLATGGLLFETMKKERIVSRYEIDVPQKTRRKGRKTKVALRFGAVEIIRPGTSRKTCDVPKIKLMAVFVEETNPPRGEEPVRWMLLTTCAVRNAKDAKRIIKFYRMRWAIEELRRNLNYRAPKVYE